MSSTVSGVEAFGTGVKKGSAWITARNSERAVVQQTYASDPKYKKYTQQVEKCLNSFDNVHEWADCIAFLKQLLKTFQSYMQFKEIPRKLIVAKRLSQCLNPALPTGVHQRALDVYAHILAILGSEGLKRDLALWSSGLFPFFEYAATSVKPALLNLYDTHYLPLQASLRPITKSFILALLPGLEEETGEFFEKVLSLLDRLSGTVSPSFFFQNIWLVMLTTPSSRETSLNFLSRRLPRLNVNEGKSLITDQTSGDTQPDITSIIGRDIGLMIRAFAAALEDDNLLVRRGALDLLLQSLRIDSAAIQRAQTEDRVILMRAATGVVLRRDLALNRRLYTWLLGPDEKSGHQISYLKEHTLDLLSSTLKDEMLSPSMDYSETRPYKIFISLLDKWEIGAALTEILVYDAFKAIEASLSSGKDDNEEVTMTASTLYEAVEPSIIWKHLLSAVFEELTGDGRKFEAIRLVLFLVKTFSQDEEIQTMHLPVVFSAILDLLNTQVLNDVSKIGTSAAGEALLLAEEILRHIPHVALMKRPELTGALQAESTTQKPYSFACMLYGITASFETPTDGESFDIPFRSSFENLVSLSIISGRQLLQSSYDDFHLQATFSQVLLLIDRLVGRLSTAITVSWNPSAWLDIVLGNVEQDHATFIIIDRAVSLVVALYQTKRLEPSPSIDDRPTMYKMVNKLLQYLRASCTMYHVRAVNLIWSLEAATKRSHVEAIIAQRMSSPESHNIQESYGAFGVLWRLTDDHLLPGFRFKVPMMIVLDALRHDDPGIRRISETWMRCSLKSYLRVLDPILFDLLDPSIRRSPTAYKVRGKELQGFSYDHPFDQRYISHLLEILQSIVKFGGKGLARTARTTQIKRSHHPALSRRTQLGTSCGVEATYIDVLVDLLLRFMLSEPQSSLVSIMQPFNATIQSTCIDILQAISSRGEMDLTTVEAIENLVIGKLYFCVHMARIDIQNKLLHLLHIVFSVSTASQDHQNKTSMATLRPGTEVVSEDDPMTDGAQVAPRSYPINPLLVQTLMDGITTSSNRPIFQHWLDFILMAVPQFQPTLQSVITPLNDCLCRQLQLCLGDIQKITSADASSAGDTLSTSTDAEITMLLNGLERLVLLSLASTSEVDGSDDDDNIVEKSPPESSGILGYVSNVFGSENVSSTSDEQLTARSPGYRSLHEGVRVLYSIWASMAWTNPHVWTSKDDSLSLICNRSRLRCRRVIEHFFRIHSAEVLESIVECWHKDRQDKNVTSHAAFELIDVLIANVQTAVHMICESISCRTAGLSERSKKQAINPNLSEAVLFTFLENYLDRLEGPLAVQVWSRFLQLAKDTLGAARDFKPQTYSTLRCLVVLATKITQTTVMDDRRVRKELQDTFTKLLDACVTWVGRSSDQGSWLRRTTREALSTNGRDSPVLRDIEKLDASSVSLPETPKLVPSAANTELITQINEYLGSSILPNVRKILQDNDKVFTACNNIMYYIVSPLMKSKSRPLDVELPVVNIIREMSKMSAALKAWRTTLVDLLNDNRFFNCTTEEAQKWLPIIKTLFEADKSALPELLAKVATSPSANIFTNREYEMLLRSLNIRRLSFILYAGDKNQFLTSLPSIQEKLVDILRNVTAPIVQSEVFLCIRVLLCRLSPHNLTSFWPVVLTELYRTFEQIMTSLPSDGSEDLLLVLAASKCLDLLITLQTQEFQIHQWIFITDTVDAIYRPDDYFPEAMLDQLAEIANSLPIGVTRKTEGNGTPDIDIHASLQASQRPMRRPLLSKIRQIDSIRDLVPFFSSISIASYESVYASGGNVDWEAVERGLMDDMLDVR